MNDAIKILINSVMHVNVLVSVFGLHGTISNDYKHGNGLFYVDENARQNVNCGGDIGFLACWPTSACHKSAIRDCTHTIEGSKFFLTLLWYN